MKIHKLADKPRTYHITECDTQMGDDTQPAATTDWAKVTCKLCLAINKKRGKK